MDVIDAAPLAGTRFGDQASAGRLRDGAPPATHGGCGLRAHRTAAAPAGAELILGHPTAGPAAGADSEARSASAAGLSGGA